jgi:hypothetical protein
MLYLEISAIKKILSILIILYFSFLPRSITKQALSIRKAKE